MRPPSIQHALGKGGRISKHMLNVIAFADVSDNCDLHARSVFFEMEAQIVALPIRMLRINSIVAKHVFRQIWKTTNGYTILVVQLLNASHAFYLWANVVARHGIFNFPEMLKALLARARPMSL